jgi:hypothetical protein
MQSLFNPLVKDMADLFSRSPEADIPSIQWHESEVA